VFGAAELFMHIDLIEADDGSGGLWPTGNSNGD
jgi:hypothetical protein